MSCLKGKVYFTQKENNNLSEENLMPKITVYEKPTCTTCRKVAKLLIESGVDFEKVNYYIEPFSKAQLQSLLKKMGMKPSELLRKNEKAYKDLKIKEMNFTEDQVLDLMIKNPDLVQRPIVEKGSKAILARPPEKINELFS
jgi:arsenate reductase